MTDHWTLEQIKTAFWDWMDKRRETVGVITNRQRWLEWEWTVFEKHLKEEGE